MFSIEHSPTYYPSGAVVLKWCYGAEILQEFGMKK